PFVSYARLLFAHVPAAALLCIGILVVADAVAESGRPRRAFVGGLLAASAVTMEYGAAFGGIPLAYVVARAAADPGRRPAALASVAGAALPIAALALYHDVVFGSPFTTPYHHVVDAHFAEVHGRGLLGLGVPSATTLYEHLLSPWGGLFYWAPLCVLALGLAGLGWRALSPVARLSTLSFVVLLLFTLGLEQTGGWRVGPRYLVVGMPLLIVPLAERLGDVAARRWLGPTLVAVVFWSAFINFVAGNLLPYPIPTGNPLADQLLPLWTEGFAPYSLLAPMFGPGGALACVGFITLVTLCWALLSLPWPGSRALMLSIAGGVAVAMAALVAALALPSSPEADTNLRALTSIWEPRAGVTVVHSELPPLAPPASSRELHDRPAAQ
ncbi:MAG: hypothetical protein AAF721_41910, partial [Myxococcota bacterium]